MRWQPTTAGAARVESVDPMPRTASSPAAPLSPPMPKPGQQRVYWRASSTPSALAYHIGAAARAHDGPLLVIARDNHGAQQLESDLRTLLARHAPGEAAAQLSAPSPPIVHFPDWETLPYDRFSPHPD